MGPVRLRAVPLQSLESKLGSTGESEMAERERRTLMIEEFFKEIGSIYGLFIATTGSLENRCNLSVNAPIRSITITTRYLAMIGSFHRR